jgi:hypothetical protein
MGQPIPSGRDMMAGCGFADGPFDARRRFEVLDFHVVPVDGERFQSLTLRRAR